MKFFCYLLCFQCIVVGIGYDNLLKFCFFLQLWLVIVWIVQENIYELFVYGVDDMIFV